MGYTKTVYTHRTVNFCAGTRVRDIINDLHKIPSYLILNSMYQHDSCVILGFSEKEVVEGNVQIQDESERLWCFVCQEPEAKLSKLVKCPLCNDCEEAWQMFFRDSALKEDCKQEEELHAK